MQNRYSRHLMSVLVLLTLLVGVAFTSFVFTKGGSQNAHAAASGNQRSRIASSAAHVIDMSQTVQDRAPASARGARQLPLLTGRTPAAYAHLKADAAHNAHAPGVTRVQTAPARQGSYTPGATKSFQGMADSARICPYFGGCQPPDMALATSSSWVLQGVNTSFAVYNTSGSLQSGWPKTAQSFFGVPNPGSCDSHGPFLSDPRAFYDINDGRFWTATLQLEGAFGIPCGLLTKYWIAYSLNGDPRGTWCAYSFDMSIGTSNVADYTQFGFDGRDVYFSGNMFDSASGNYSYAEAFSFTKPAKGSTSCAGGFSAWGFTHLTTPDGVLADTVQPVMAETPSYDTPRGGLFISSYNINSGGGQCFFGCSGAVIWAFANPGTSSISLSTLKVATSTYALAPNGDEPGCGGCIETLDTRISATPVYHNGLITFALETGANNGSQTVPSIFWGQITPTLDDTGHIINLSVYQSGYQVYVGDGSASFGALMPDLEGDLFMVFDYMDNSTNPEVAYVGRRSTFALGFFHDGGLVLHGGSAPTFDSRWGDFEAASYDGFSKDNVWFAGQYSGSNADWSTYIGRDQYCSSCNIVQ